MRIHLIAIGGSAMHNFALALDHLGQRLAIDDQIFEPSRGRLDAAVCFLIAGLGGKQNNR